MVLPPPTSTLFPYTTLFRSAHAHLTSRIADVHLPFRDERRHGDRLAYPDVGEQRAPDRLAGVGVQRDRLSDRKSTRLNSSHVEISYAVFCLKKKMLFFLLLT